MAKYMVFIERKAMRMDDDDKFVDETTYEAEED